MEEKVDILLSTYNTKKEYLIKQIDSILNQTYKNFNLIISDDSSTDKTVEELLKEYEKKDDRIKLFIQPQNLGCTKNFEFLLNKSTSEYIAFSDHDDIWNLDKIEKMLNILKEKDVSLVYCDAEQIDKDENILHDSYLKYKNLPVFSGKNNIITFSRHIAIGCSQLFTKEVKEKMLPFTQNTLVHDWHGIYIASTLKGVYCLNEALLKYRIHENNICGGRNFKQNMKIWKDENGKSYKSYLKYRHKVIIETYLAGSLMCKDYSILLKNSVLRKEENGVIKYYKKSQNAKIIYLPIHKYFKYLYFKGINKRIFKEIMILHFPLISYIIYAIS